MAIALKQSTASQEIVLGPFLDDTDGKTAETGLTIANTDLDLWVAGATTLADKTSGGATHIAGGIYSAVLDATDTATVGPLVVFCHMAGALPVKVECEVLPADMYDTKFGGNTLIERLVDSWATFHGGTAQAGAAGSITLAAGASATSAFYDGYTVYIHTGTGIGQARQITTYDGGTKVASVDPNWLTTPDNTSQYHVYPTAPAPTAALIGVNVVQISGDATAADNLELACDGTSYNLGGGDIVAASVSGAVGSVTGAVGSVTGGVTLANGAHGGAAFELTGKKIALANSDAGGIAFSAVGSGTGNSHGANFGSTNGKGLAIGSTNNVGMSVDGVGDTDLTIGATALNATTLMQIVADLADAGRLDALIDAIKAKTDSLTFTVASTVDANITAVGGDAITAAKPYDVA